MDLASALTAAMKQNGLRDEHVAILVGTSAQTVMKWRTGGAAPSQKNYDALRKEIKGFADLKDREAVA